MNFVLIADLNDFDNYHVGDEAMFEANLCRLRELFPGAGFTVISQNPEFSSQHYNVNALPYFGFSKSARANSLRQARLTEILCQAEKRKNNRLLEETPGGWDKIFDALENCDALIVSGGGNISSTWPHHIFERAALIKIAGLYGKPAIVTGQTLGPFFTPEDLVLLKETLPLARLIGVREKASIELCRKLGLPQTKISYQLDDAAFLEPTPPGADDDRQFIARLTAGQKPWIAVTIHNFTDLETENGQAQLKALAGQIAKVARQTGAQPVFVPHVAAAAGNGIVPDAAVGRELARLLGPEIEMPVLKVRPAGEVRWLTGQAALVISTRYHPLVFGLAAGVPALGIYVDQYTRIKLKGSLEHAGLEEWVIPVELARTELMSKLALELWQSRKEISRHLEMVRQGWKEEYQDHWQRVCACIKGAPAPLENFEVITENGGASQQEKPTFKTGFEKEEPEENRAIKPSSFLAGLIGELAELQSTSSNHFEEAATETNRYIASLVEEITTLRRMQSEKDAYIGSMKQATVEKDTYIHSLKEAFAEKDTYIHSLKDAIVQKDTYIDSLREALAEKDIYIDRLREALAEKALTR